MDRDTPTATAVPNANKREGNKNRLCPLSWALDGAAWGPGVAVQGLWSFKCHRLLSQLLNMRSEIGRVLKILCNSVTSSSPFRWFSIPQGGWLCSPKSTASRLLIVLPAKIFSSSAGKPGSLSPENDKKCTKSRLLRWLTLCKTRSNKRKAGQGKA